MAWRGLVRSATGTRHQKQQQPCQDYGACLMLDKVAVGAVADGAGSAALAEMGAKLAVDRVMRFLESSNRVLSRKHRLEKAFTEIEARQVFGRATEHAIAALERYAAENNCNLSDLACTLLIFVATPHWVASMQIGDGFILVHPDGSDYQLLCQPQKGEYANETAFITSPQALDEMQVTVLEGEQQFVCVATDAIERVAIQLRDWTPFPPFFHKLEEYLQETENPEQDDAYLVDFLESERLSERTDDDKTLLLCLYEA